jgi:hypothetical protein
MSEPRWTKEKPKEPGWYWTRYRSNDKAYPTEIDEDGYVVSSLDRKSFTWWPVRIEPPKVEP